MISQCTIFKEDFGLDIILWNTLAIAPLASLILQSFRGYGLHYQLPPVVSVICCNPSVVNTVHVLASLATPSPHFSLGMLFLEEYLLRNVSGIWYIYVPGPDDVNGYVTSSIAGVSNDRRNPYVLRFALNTIIMLHLFTFVCIINYFDLLSFFTFYDLYTCGHVYFSATCYRVRK